MRGRGCGGHAGKHHKPQTVHQQSNQPHGFYWGPLRRQDRDARAHRQAKHATGRYLIQILRQTRNH